MRSFFLLAFVFLLVLPIGTWAGVLPLGTPIPPHPRILLLKGGERELRKAIRGDGIWMNIHNTIIRESDGMLKLPPVQRVLIGRRLLDKSREALRRIFYLSYSWRMTGERKYFERAEREILAVCGFSDWNPSHFLDVAEMTMAVAIGYDWLFNDLTQESKWVIKKAIVTRGLGPSLDSRYNSWLEKSNNWNQVCNAGMSFGALAVYEDYPEMAHEIIERAVKTVPTSMSAYKPDGAYPEGYTYWGYGTSFNVLLIDALEKVFKTDYGLSSQTGFMQTAAYLENMTGPSERGFNYSDAHEEAELNPAMCWFARRTNKSSLLFEETKLLSGGGNWGKIRILPALLVWGAGIRTKTVTAPDQLLWIGRGPTPVLAMRTSWTEPDAIYVAMKGGSPSTSHAHMDVGSFVMDAMHERWAMDLGMQEYNSLESKGVKLWDFQQDGDRWEILRYNNYFHNTLTFDDALQRVKGQAPFLKFSDQNDFLSGVVDLSKIYEGQVVKALRGIAIVNKEYVVVRDEIKTGDKETSLRWTMVTQAKVKTTGEETATLDLNGKKMHLKVLGLPGVKMRTWSTLPVENYDAPNEGTIRVGFEVPLPRASSVALTVLLLPDDATPVSAIDSRELKDWPVSIDK